MNWLHTLWIPQCTTFEWNEWKQAREKQHTSLQQNEGFRTYWFIYKLKLPLQSDCAALFCVMYAYVLWHTLHIHAWIVSTHTLTTYCIHIPFTKFSILFDRLLRTVDIVSNIEIGSINTNSQEKQWISDVPRILFQVDSGFSWMHFVNRAEKNYATLQKCILVPNSTRVYKIHIATKRNIRHSKTMVQYRKNGRDLASFPCVVIFFTFRAKVHTFRISHPFRIHKARFRWPLNQNQSYRSQIPDACKTWRVWSRLSIYFCSDSGKCA